MSDSHAPLVHLMEPGAAHPAAAHARLAMRFDLTLAEADASMTPPATALSRLGLDRFNLLASGGASRTAQALARAAGERVLALVLENPHAPDAEALATPTLVLLGTRVDAALHAAGQAWAKHVPGAHLVYVYDAGSAIGADRPEAFAEVVGDFLDRHEAFVINRNRTVIHP